MMDTEPDIGQLMLITYIVLSKYSEVTVEVLADNLENIYPYVNVLRPCYQPAGPGGGDFTVQVPMYSSTCLDSG